MDLLAKSIPRVEVVVGERGHFAQGVGGAERPPQK
jgi:hypothetical protein